MSVIMACTGLLAGLSNPAVAVDTTPDPFTFPALTAVLANAPVRSEPITVSGIDAPATIRIAGGTYSVNDSGSYGSARGTVVNGDSVRVRLTSARNSLATACATLTIGEVSGAFCATTAPAVTPAWTYVAPGSSFETPAIGPDGTIYFATRESLDTGKLHAVRPDGTARWTLALGASLDPSVVIAADGTVYVCTFRPARVVAVRPDGTTRWSMDLANPAFKTPALGADGTLFFVSGIRGTFNEALTAVAPDGTVKWTLDIGPFDTAAGNLAIGVNGNVHAMNKIVSPQGKLLHTAAVVSRFIAITADGGILSSGGSMQLPQGRGGFIAMNPDGSVRWTLPLVGSSFPIGTPAIAPNGTIYVQVTGSFPALYALTSEGAVRWFRELGDTSSDHGGPAVAQDGTVMLGASAFDPAGNVRWSASAGGVVYGAANIGADGTVYRLASSYDEKGSSIAILSAVRSPAGPAARSSWPMLGRDPGHTGFARSDCLYDWAEQAHAQLFSPSGAPTRFDAPYTYRHYPGTNAYLGTLAGEDQLYYLGPASAGMVIGLGRLADWLVSTGCH